MLLLLLRCNKSVYQAEEVRGASSVWHRRCFRCLTCGRGLDSTTMQDHQGEIYCQSCHQRQFGMKGIGYGHALRETGVDSTTEVVKGETQQDAFARVKPSLPASSSSSSSSSCSNCQRILGAADRFCSGCGTPRVSHTPAAVPRRSPPAASSSSGAAATGSSAFTNTNRSNGCQRCGKSVYAAEKASAGGRTYHRRCFVCTSCGKGLDSTTLAEKDNHLYCASCYSRDFGPHGFRR